MPGPAQDMPQLAGDWANSAVRVVGMGADGEEGVRLACAEAGLSPAFADAITSSYDGATAAWAALSDDLPFASDSRLSPRVKDVCAAVALGAKPILCPFTGARALVRDTIDTHTFLHRAAGRMCVILPDWRIEHAAGDRCWFFPDRNLLLSSTPGLDGRAALARTAARVMACRDRVAAYLADPDRAMMVSEDANGHIGHYIWNVVSGWSPLFARVPAERIGILTSYPGWDPFGGVTQLYPDQAGRAGEVVRPSTDLALYELMLDRRATSLTLLDRHVTAETADRIIGWSRGRCSPAFLAAVADLRRSTSPLIMLTIRTENRAWVEQRDGYANLINALSANMPGLGVILDGINGGMDQVGSHGLMSLDDERAIAASIMAACPGTRFHDALGCLPQESIVLATAIDAFVAPIGAGLAKTRWVANKPGVGFSNATFLQPGHYDGRLYDAFRDVLAPMRYVDQSDVADTEEARHNEKGRANFSMSWQAPCQALKALLDAL